MKEKIAVGLSGGIDSSFAAYLLNKEGFQVIGFTLKFYPEENRCCDLDSLYQAQRLCHKLGIPHYTIDVRDLFKREIINYFIESYLQGLTPNPCSFCNRLIKFGYLLKKIQSLGITYLATGHYVRIKKKDKKAFLAMAKDKKKSQEYFLSLIEPFSLNHLIFPLGEYTKGEVREITHREKLIFKERSESQDICFIKDGSYPKFIEDSISNLEHYRGKIKYIKGGILGTHRGIYNFTTGQREGLGISWKNPLYVYDIQSDTTTVIVAEREYLYKDKFAVSSCNWFISPTKFKDISVKIRYNSPSYPCEIEVEGEKALVYLKEKVDSISPGQIATFYWKDLVLGGGVISKKGLRD
jgi:tRNA-specific 2-thiouridylase